MLPNTREQGAKMIRVEQPACTSKCSEWGSLVPGLVTVSSPSWGQN